MNDTAQILLQLKEICEGNHSQWYSPLLGALLAGIGGFFAVVIRLRLEEKQKIDFIKVSLCDELHEICSIVDKMSETHRTSSNIPKIYFDELLENTESFKHHKKALYIIGDSKLRKDISEFYKKIETDIKKSQDDVGNINSPPNIATEVTHRFETAKHSAGTLKTKIENYKYKIFYVI